MPKSSIIGKAKQKDIREYNNTSKSVISRNIEYLCKLEFVKIEREDKFDNRPSYSLTFEGLLFLFASGFDVEVANIFKNFNSIFNANFSSSQIFWLEDSFDKSKLKPFLCLIGVHWLMFGRETFKMFVQWLDFNKKDLPQLIEQLESSGKPNDNQYNMEVGNLIGFFESVSIIRKNENISHGFDFDKFLDGIFSVLEPKDTKIVRNYFEKIIEDWIEMSITLFQEEIMKLKVAKKEFKDFKKIIDNSMKKRLANI